MNSRANAPRSKSSIKPESSQSETVPHRRTKRLRIESDEEDDENYEQRQERRTSYNESYTRRDAGSNSPDAVVATKKPKLVVRSSADDEESEYNATVRSYDEPKDDEEDSHGEYEGRHGMKRRSPRSFSPSRTHSSPPPSTGLAGFSSDHAAPAGKARKMSIKAKYIVSQASTSTPTSASKKTSSSKGKQKASHPSMNKRKRRQEEEDEEEEEYQDFEEVDVEEEEEEASFSDDYEEDEEDERPSRGKKGRGGVGRGGGGKAKEREREKEKDTTPILKKAKFEGNPAALGSAAGAKRPRTKKPVGEDSLVDIVGDSGTPEPSSIGSPPTANPTNEGTKDDNVSGSAPPLKKRKLPTIKKLKNSTSVGGSGGPSTPSSTTATGSKPPALPPPPPSSVAVNGANKLGIVEGNKPTRPKTNATSDLDLSNPSLYAELFKNPGGSASRTGLNRRAKEEERRKELDKMRDEYKAKFAEQAKISFDLQGQAEKMARFEETLRERRSSALYPNFLAAKWREEWEREKRRAHKREYRQQEPQQTTNTDSGKEEGEM